MQFVKVVDRSDPRQFKPGFAGGLFDEIGNGCGLIQSDGVIATLS